MLYQVTKKHNFLPEVLCFSVCSVSELALLIVTWCRHELKRTHMLSYDTVFPCLPVLLTCLEWLRELFLSFVYPQAFTTDFRVHWAQHPLRPEFAESTYFLYKVIHLGSLTECREDLFRLLLFVLIKGHYSSTTLLLALHMYSLLSNCTH